MNYRLPNINAPDTKGQIVQMHSYLRQLVQDMNMNLQTQEEEAQRQQEQQVQNQEEPFSPIRCYPVGSIYISVSGTDPEALFGGRWEQLKDRFLLAGGDKYMPGSVGGEAEVRLSLDQMPVHGHSFNHGYAYAAKGGEETMTGSGGSLKQTTTAGGGQAHNNMPPYLAVYVWKRIA